MGAEPRPPQAVFTREVTQSGFKVVGEEKSTCTETLRPLFEKVDARGPAATNKPAHQAPGT